MWSLGVVSGWWIYCLPHNKVFLLLLCLFLWQNNLEVGVHFTLRQVYSVLLQYKQWIYAKYFVYTCYNINHTS